MLLLGTLATCGLPLWDLVQNLIVLVTGCHKSLISLGLGMQALDVYVHTVQREQTYSLLITGPCQSVSDKEQHAWTLWSGTFLYLHLY